MSGFWEGFLQKYISNKYLFSAVLAVLPVSEIKGSVLYAAICGINRFYAFCLSLASSAAMIWVLCKCFPALLNALSRANRIKKIPGLLLDRLEIKAGKIADKAGADTEREYKNRLALGVCLFVAVPLPLTGLWTGAVLCSIIKLDFKRSFTALFCGNFVAGIIVYLVSVLFCGREEIVFNAFLVLAAAGVLFTCVKGVFKSKFNSLAKRQNAK